MVKTTKAVWNWNVQILFYSFSFALPVFTLHASLFFTWASQNIYSQCHSCSLPARLIKARCWGVFHQTLCNPSVDNSKILWNPTPWHRFKCLPDISIKPHRGKPFPVLIYLHNCNDLQRLWHRDTSFLGNSKYFSCFSGEGRKRKWIALWSWSHDYKKSKMKDSSRDGKNASLLLKIKDTVNVFSICSYTQLEWTTTLYFLTFIFSPPFWHKEIFSCLPKHTTVTSLNIQCLRERKCW